MQVHRWMSPDPTTASPEETIEEVRKRMDYYDVHHMPIMSGDKLVGIVSDRDIYSQPESQRAVRTIREVMSQPPTTVRTDDQISDAARRMLAGRFNALPVLDEANQLVGVLTSTDCLLAMLELHAEEG